MSRTTCPNCYKRINPLNVNNIATCPKCGKSLEQQSDWKLKIGSGATGPSLAAPLQGAGSSNIGVPYKKTSDNLGQKLCIIFFIATIILSLVVGGGISGALCINFGSCDQFPQWFGLFFLIFLVVFGCAAGYYYLENK